MEKMKTHRMVYFLLIAVIAFAIRPSLYGQDYLPKERENEIKMSGRYYWGEGSDFVEELAKLSASVELSNQIIKDAVGQSGQLDEILKAIDLGAHLERLPQQGKIKILAWIAKDSVLLMVATQRPITQNYVSQSVPPVPDVQKEEDVPQPVPSGSDVQKEEEAYVPTPENAPTSKMNSVATTNPVLQELAGCKTYKEVRRMATKNGLVRGEIGSGSKGFLNPENCIIAVFTADGTLSALLDTGGNSRTDLLSGQTVQNPDRYYNQGGYYLWYMQQKKASSGETGNIQNNSSSFTGSVQAPPIENTSRYANAAILLPRDWDGKSVLINSFVWIGIDDTELQDKYNVHPGDTYGFYDDHEIRDDDKTYYKYPLSPDVVIEAGIRSEGNTTSSTRKMTVNEFANYMRSLWWAVEGDNNNNNVAYGIVADVTYKNGMITKIVERDIP